MNCQRCNAQIGAEEHVCRSCGTNREPAEIIRSQALEVIVRHAISDPNWRATCKMIMSVNSITEEEVAAAAAKRGESLRSAPEPTVPKSSQSSISFSNGESKRASGQHKWNPPPGNNLSFTVQPTESIEQLEELRDKLRGLGAACEADVALLKQQLANVASELEKTLQTLQTEIEKLQQAQVEMVANVENVDKELHRTTQPIVPPETDDKFRVDLNQPDNNT